MSHFAQGAYDPLTGKGLVGGTASVVQPGTSTLLTIYSNPAFTAQKTNPMVLGADSMIDFYLHPGIPFDVILKNQAGVVITTLSNRRVHRAPDGPMGPFMVGQLGEPLNRHYIAGCITAGAFAASALIADFMVAVPMAISGDRTIDQVFAHVSVGGLPGFAQGRVGIYSNIGQGRLYPGALLAQGNTFRVDTTGLKSSVVSLPVTDGQIIHLALFHGAADTSPQFTVVPVGNSLGMYGSTSSILAPDNQLRATQVFGAGSFPATFPGGIAPVNSSIPVLGVTFA